MVGVVFLPSLLMAQGKMVVPTEPIQQTTDSIQKDYEFFEGDPLNTRKYVLKNGLTVYLSPNKREPRVQAMVVVRTGSRNDPADNTGLAHYLEHMLFKGTQHYGTKNYKFEKPMLEQIETLFELHKNTKDTALRKLLYYRIDSISYLASQTAIANEYDKMMQIMGVNGVNAYTSFDETVYINNIPSNQIYKWLEIEAERFSNPVFRLFHTELEAVYEEKNRSLDSDDSKAFEALFAGVFPGHPYGTQTTIGTVDHLKNPSIKAIKQYFHTYYVPSNMALVLSGDFDPDSLIQVIDAHFSKWINLPRPKEVVYPPITRWPSHEAEVFGPDPEYVMFAYPMPSGKEKAFAYTEVINSLLYNGKAGLLDQDLNLTQKVQSSYCFNYGLNDKGSHIFVGIPRENQTLGEVQKLILSEITKIKKGEFDEKLLQAIIDNKELELLRGYQDNYNRCSEIADAFIRDYSWKEYQEILNAYKSIKKEDLIAFANEWYGNDKFFTVYKREGEDTSVAKITKPQIKPIELNKGKESQWLKEHVYDKVEPIVPKFVNFKEDLKQTKTASGLDMFYVQNKENDLFSLYYVLEMGSYNDLKTAFAIELLPYLGTDKYTVDELNMRFYELAADFGVASGSDRIYVYLNGLQKNFDASLELFEHLLRNAKPDQEALNALVARTLKGREDAMKNKSSILFGAMMNYAMYGEKNPFTHKLKRAELESLKAEDLTNMIHGILDYNHYIFYFGPKGMEEMNASINQKHKVLPELKAYPPAVTFDFQKAPKKDQVFFVDFDMVQAEVLWIRNAGEYDEKMVPTIRLFNEYFDGGMGTVVFQELRESKALAYSTYARFIPAAKPEMPNYIMAYIGTQSDKLNDAVPAMVNLFNTAPSDESAINKARVSLKQNLETKRVMEEDIFFSYLSAKRMGRDYDINQVIYSQLDEVKMEDVTAFQMTYFGDKAYYYCVLGSKDKISKKDLKKYGKVKVLTLEEVFGEE